MYKKKKSIEKKIYKNGEYSEVWNNSPEYTSIQP